MVINERNAPLDFGRVSREQLELYAREFQKHYLEQRRLRHELEERNRQLELRLRELTALNRIVQLHIDEHFAVIDAYKKLLEELESSPENLVDIVQRAQSQPIFDLQPMTNNLLATSKSGTHWDPRDQVLDGGLVSSLRALL